MAQVKFYSVAADATRSDANGIYFVTGGELYKGTSRFGLGRVTTVEDVATLTSAARGDININGGVTKVFDGTNWVVAASAFTLPAFTTGDAAGQVKLGSVNATVNGWDGLVASVSANTSSIAGLSTTVASLSSRVGTLETKVSGIESIVDTADGGTVTAASGVFTNLTVSDTATFSATTVSATTLTIGGSDISDLISAGADARISAAKLSGSISASDGAGLVNEGQVVTYVSAQLQSFDNAMHFKGAGTALPASAVAGDVYVFTGNATDESGYKAGQEVVYTGSAWEVIGDQNTYAVNAYTSTASVYTGVTTVPGALDAVGAAADTFQAALDAKVTGGSEVSDVNKGTNLVTAGAVTNYVSQEITNLSLGTAAQKNYADSLTSTGTSLPTESAVAGYVTGIVEGLDASVSSSENASIKVGVTQVDGKVTSVTADLVWLGADGNALT